MRIAIALSTALFLVFCLSLAPTVRAKEKAECEHWSEQSKRYVTWSSAHWQREQCAQFNIHFSN